MHPASRRKKYEEGINLAVSYADQISRFRLGFDDRILKPITYPGTEIPYHSEQFGTESYGPLEYKFEDQPFLIFPSTLTGVKGNILRLNMLRN